MRTRGPIAFPTSFPPCARAAVQADKTMAMRSDVILTLITQTVEEFLMWLQWEGQFKTIAVNLSYSSYVHLKDPGGLEVTPLDHGKKIIFDILNKIF